MANPGMSAVLLEDVYCVHRTAEGDAAALSGITLAVEQGELLCVLGPSGAGKSTLLRVIAGLQVPSAGVVCMLDTDVGRCSARERSKIRHDQIGFLHQRAESALGPDLPIRESVALPLALRGVPRAAQRARARELLAAVGLADRAGVLPAALSGGERQRVALCAALAHQPKLLLADEPTGELDAASANTLRTLIASLVQAHAATAVLVSHDPGSARIADRTIRIRDGRVVQEQRDSTEMIVVGRGGWVQIPSALLDRAGIGERARIRELPGGLRLESAGPAAGRESASATAHASRGRARDEERGIRHTACVELHDLIRDKGRGAAKRRVLDGLTWVVAPGRLTVVSGRSGSGKTTLLRLIAGLERPEAGYVKIDDQPLSELDPEQTAALRRARIGYLPQEPWPVGFLSAEENVILALLVRGWGRHDAAVRAAEVLDRVELARRSRQRVARLSAGEAQRVALARALAGAAGLLIADEPTSRLDEASAANVAELLRAAAREEGQTVICATHDDQVTRRAEALVALKG